MQTEKLENMESMKEKGEQKTETPPNNLNEDLTFGKSPIKTPRRIVNKVNNHNEPFIRNRIFTEFCSKDNKLHLIKTENQNLNNINISSNLSNSRRKKEFKIEEKSRDKNAYLNLKQRNLAPNESLFNDLKNIKDNDEEINFDVDFYKKKKKDWKSWSPQEKELFYEAIANGGNYSSLQKLFKNMNDKIGTKSTEKIRDYYYRALKNVNKLLRSVGDSGINRKNRDEVLLALNCYGKMITSSNSKKKSNLDAMKKLNRHPRLFKKTALSLKKLIMRGVKSMRAKKISNKQNKSKNISKNMTFKKEYKINNNTMNNMFPHVKIIDPDIGRKIPYDKFTLKLTPYDQETYFKMIESNYSSRFEISVSYNKSLKQLIEILADKWKNIVKKYKSISLYLCPLEDIWIPSEITFFSSNDSSKAYDIGDIYTAYGCPATNIILMHYQWNEGHGQVNSHQGRTDIVSNNGISNNAVNSNIVVENNFNNIINSNTNLGANSLLAQPSLNLEHSHKANSLNNSQVNMEDLLNSANESEEDKEKSFIPLEQEYDEFDPLEFLGIYKTKGNKNALNNSSDGDMDEYFDLNYEDNDNRMWDDDEFCEIDNLRNISPSVKSFNNDNLNVSNNENKTDNLVKEDNEHSINFEDVNDPYKRIDYFNKIRHKPHPISRFNDILNNNPVSVPASNNNNIFVRNLNNNVKKNLLTISECDSNLDKNSIVNSQTLDKILNFQDLNSKIKSNTLSLTLSNNPKVENGKNMTTGNANTNNNTLNYKNFQNQTLNNKSNENSQNKMKKRIPFTNMNNNNKANFISTSVDKNITNNIQKESLPVDDVDNVVDNQTSNENDENVKNDIKNKELTSPIANANNFPNNTINQLQSENTNTNLHFYSLLNNSLGKSRNFESFLNNTSSNNNKQISSFADRKEDISNFNGENSNFFNYNTNHHQMGGLFDQESNMNLLKNYNNSLLFGDNMFNSNHLNSMFVMKNMEDTMMKKVNIGETSLTPLNTSNNLQESITLRNIKTENEVRIENKNENTVSVNLTNEEDDKLLNKKSNRKKKEVKNKKRTTPVNLDEILRECDERKEDEEKNKIKKSKSKSKIKSEKEEKSASNLKESNNNNNISLNNNNNFAFYPNNNFNPVPVHPHPSLFNPQNINISNTNPYIINQNNYFNNYNHLNSFANQVPPIEQNVPQRIIYKPPQNNLDIPHPNNFLTPQNPLTMPVNNNNIKNGLQYVAGPDMNYMWNYGGVNRYPPYLYNRPQIFPPSSTEIYNKPILNNNSNSNISKKKM